MTDTIDTVTTERAMFDRSLGVEVPAGTRLRVRIPAREVILATEAPQGISLHNILPVQVTGITEDAARHTAMVELGSGEFRLLARITPDAVARLGLAPGRPVLALVKSMSVDVVG